VFGNATYPAQFAHPYEKDELGAITVDNNRVRRVMQSIALLTEYCLVDVGKRTKWNTAVKEYNKAMELLRMRRSLTDAEIQRFQLHADRFANLYVALEGYDGQTNYTHLLISGHLADYLQYWRNLYIHSQQGWGAFNSLIKVMFFRRTQHGGAGGCGTSSRSRLKPLARWMLRRLMWMLAIPYEHMLEWYNNQLWQDEDEAVRATETDEILDHMFESENTMQFGVL
jgi:hypothetical protein